jgi:transposase
MKPLSQDLRRRVVEAYEWERGSIRALARRFAVSQSSVFRFLDQYRATGTLAPRPHGGGVRPRLDEPALQTLERLINERPDATLQELRERLAQAGGAYVHPSTVWRALKRLGKRRKKKTFRAKEQDDPAVQAKRQDYQAEIAQLDPRDLVFVDESGVNQAMARIYAWARGGERARAVRPVRRGQALTLVGALGWEGLQAPFSLEGAMNGHTFLFYVENLLAPSLRPGQTVMMDNLSAHYTDGVEEAIEAVGARVLHLPPYSPELSPIELCWSKVKTYLRAEGARTLEGLHAAVTAALNTIPPKDAKSWFQHCGYCAQS